VLFSRKSYIITIDKNVLEVFLGVLTGMGRGSFKTVLIHAKKKSTLKVEELQGIPNITIDGVIVDVPGLKGVLANIDSNPDTEKGIVRVKSGHYAYRYKPDLNQIIINANNNS